MWTDLRGEIDLMFASLLVFEWDGLRVVRARDIGGTSDVPVDPDKLRQQKSAWNRTYREKHADKERERKRAWRAKNREKERERHANWRAKRKVAA